MASAVALRFRPFFGVTWSRLGAPLGVSGVPRPLGAPPLPFFCERRLVFTPSGPWNASLRRESVISTKNGLLNGCRFGAAPQAEPLAHSRCTSGISAAAEAEKNKTPAECQFDHASRFVKDGYRLPVGFWLLGLTSWVFLMVVWGGLTRLTESGLSMTRWRFMGSAWPATEEAWAEEFEAYKKTPEYLQLNQGMSLDDYKRIYFFEFAHRWLGRGVGLLFGVGAAACALTQCIKRPLAIRLTIYGLLGGFQGLVGWWMVRSGFEEPTTEVKTPRVSPYRLAFHLVTALSLYTLLLWQTLGLLIPSPVGTAAALAAAAAAKKHAHAVAAIAGLTFASGAFVAGNDAGRCCNTWPKMLDNWVPPELYEQPITWKRFFENPETVQFDHRCLAYLTFISSWLLYFSNRNKPLPPRIQTALRFLPLMTSLQLLLGITTLLFYVPTELGVLHQAGGLLTMSSAIYLMHLLSRLKIKP